MWSEKYTKEELKYIQSKPNILAIIIKKYPNENWNFYELSSNPNITWDIIDIFIDKNWDWSKLSQFNPHINIQIIKKYVNYWKWGALSRNFYITQEIINTFIDKPWDWTVIIRNTNFECILKYTSRYEININSFVNKICWKSLSQNPQLDFNFVKKYSDKPWDWSFLSNHTNLSINFILKNINLPWNWHLIIIEKKFDIFQIINKFPHIKNYIYTCVESNPFIPIEYLEKRVLQDIDIRESLSKNYFLFNRNCLEQSMNKDNLINTILVLETIDNKNTIAKNINCKSDICDYNVINIIKEMLY
jgi:hypothetical protein